MPSYVYSSLLILIYNNKKATFVNKWKDNHDSVSRGFLNKQNDGGEYVKSVEKHVDPFSHWFEQYYSHIVPAWTSLTMIETFQHDFYVNLTFCGNRLINNIP